MLFYPIIVNISFDLLVKELPVKFFNMKLFFCPHNL